MNLLSGMFESAFCVCQAGERRGEPTGKTEMLEKSLNTPQKPPEIEKEKAASSTCQLSKMWT